MAADDGQERDAPGDAAREPARRRLEAGQAEHVPAQSERVGQGVGDPLAVEEQVGQVVGDKVAHGDRDEPGDQGRDADAPPDRVRGQPDERQPGDEQERLSADGRRAERVEEGLGLGQAVVQDPGDGEGDHHQAREVTLGVEQPGGEPADRDPARALGGGIARQGQRREAADEAEPDREDLAVAPPGGPPVLGHRDEGEDGVTEHDEPEGLPAAGRRDGQLEPDEERQADRGGPSSEAGRIGRRGATGEPDRSESGREQPVERAERVEVLPGRADEGADHGQPDPPVDPQEEGRDVALGVTSQDDSLDHDPGPAEQPDRGQGDRDGAGDADRPGRRRLRVRADRRTRSPEDDRERRGHRGDRAYEIGAERDRRREPPGQLVGAHDRRRGEGDEQARDRRRRSSPDGGRAPGDGAAAHDGGVYPASSAEGWPDIPGMRAPGRG